ncbi:MAG: hypothetical protein QM533_06815 [Cytophagales bacterium]|nr:hypothetical protein [Cytophagales bacterium]
MSKLDSPLDLTVHRLPILSADRTSLGRWKMLVVLLVCAAPVVASYLTYYVIRPSNVKSFGELVQPQRPMPNLSATTLDGQATALASLRGQWLLASVAGGACAKPCEQHLYLQRQLRETLGKDKDRLDWLWLITDDAPLAPELRARLTDPAMKTQGFSALRIKESDAAAWLQGGTDQLSTRLYLIDPQGNYMMRFPENLGVEQAAKAKADISRLLRASSFWDLPGRENIQKSTHPESAVGQDFDKLNPNGAKK